MTRLRELAKRFRRDSGGQAAIIFGLASIPLVVMLGMAVDYSNLVSNKKHLQATLDAAALASAAAYANSNADYAGVAQTYFNTNAPSALKASPPVVQVSVDPQTLKLRATVDATFHNTIMSIVGQGTSNVDASTTVSLPVFSDYHKGEIALVLDYSDSMTDRIDGVKKYVSMRDEATKLINSLSQDGANSDVKFAVVPFSGEVYLTMPKNYWYGKSGSGDYTSCTRDRKYPYNTEDSTPESGTSRSAKATRFGQETKRNDPYDIRCSAYESRNLKVRNLTTDHAGTVAAITAMEPYMYTHIALGMEIGYHVLSPNAPFSEGVAYNTENTLKAVVLLTDGAQTTYAWGEDDDLSRRNGEENLETLCTNMKNDGIRILTVAYDLDDEDSTTRLRNCASSEDDAFVANDTEELASAFGVITNKLARVMYISE
jgi:Flp pilus assembly protein TadG